jgi:Ca-activated chloride channel family protein
MRKELLPIEKAEFALEFQNVEVPPELLLRVDCIPAWMTDFDQATSKKTRASLEERKASAERANIAFIPRCELMKPLLHQSEVSCGFSRMLMRTTICVLALFLFCLTALLAQDDPLNKVHVPPPSATVPATGAPTGVDAPTATGTASARAKPGSLIRMNVDMVLVPVTVTDPMNRLVTGLEQEDFQVYENSGEQRIKSFAAEDAPVSIGIVFDLSGSMTSKLLRAREAILQFIKTANPQDEFFVIGFNDRPELIEDFTNSVEDIEARLAMVRSGHRTALLDAIYYGVTKMREAKHERKALLVVSDGGDNRSRYTEGEVRAQVRESDVEIYSIGIFDPYAATPEERTGPILLNDLCEETGGRLFRVDDVSEMSDIAEKISTELRNQYVIGYTPKNISRDGKWRKVKVKLNPPSGLPPLTIHARTGYYAPLQ